MTDQKSSSADRLDPASIALADWIEEQRPTSQDYPGVFGLNPENWDHIVWALRRVGAGSIADVVVPEAGREIGIRQCITVVRGKMGDEFGGPIIADLEALLSTTRPAPAGRGEMGKIELAIKRLVKDVAAHTRNVCAGQPLPHAEQIDLQEQTLALIRRALSQGVAVTPTPSQDAGEGR